MLLDLIQNHRKSFKIIIINLSISLSILFAMNNPNSIKEVIVNDEWFAEVQIGEYMLNCRIAGMENDGETIILLHGFPETSYMWVDLMKVLAEKGYRVIAPDQRGYSPNARPTFIKEYSNEQLYVPLPCIFPPTMISSPSEVSRIDLNFSL